MQDVPFLNKWAFIAVIGIKKIGKKLVKNEESKANNRLVLFSLKKVF